MFSSRVLKLIGSSINFFERTRCFPFTWDSTSNTIKLSNSKFTKIVSILFLLHTFLYAIFSWSKLCLLLSRTAQLKVIDMYWLSAYGWGLTVSGEGIYNSMRRGDEWVFFFKQIFKLDKIFCDVEIPDMIKRRKWGEKLMFFICKGNIAAGLSAAGLSTLLTIVAPKAAQYLYSSLPPKNQTTFTLVLCFINELLSKGVLITWFCLVHCWFLCAVAFETTSLTFIRKCSDQLPKKLLLYQYLYMLNHLHNECYLPTVVPARVTLFGYFTIKGAVMLVRFRQALNAVELILVVELFIGFQIVMFLFLHISGSVFKGSNRLLDMFRTCEEVGRNRELLKRVIKSLRPFGVRIK